MNSKKKLTISLIVAVSILIIAVAAIVAISAAANQQIKSNIKVHYKVDPEVIGSVSATYTFNDEIHSMTTNGERVGVNNSKVWFRYKERPTTKTLQLQSEDLTDGALNFNYGETEMIICFTFENTGKTDFTASLAIEEIDSENINITYSFDKSTWQLSLPSVDVNAPGGHQESVEAVCYIKISLNNRSANGEFSGSFTWHLEADMLNH